MEKFGASVSVLQSGHNDPTAADDKLYLVYYHDVGVPE